MTEVSPRRAAPRLQRRHLWFLAGAFTVLGLGVLVVRHLTPHAVEPAPLAVPSLDRQAVRKQLAEDATAAAALPDSGSVRALIALLEERGLAETGRPEPMERSLERSRRMMRAVSAVVSEHGQDALVALRAERAERVLAALAAPDSRDRRALLGGFDSVIDAYGSSSDQRPAGDFVIRIMFKARVNVALGLDRNDGLSEIERLAMWGWMTFGATRLEPVRRLPFLVHYEAAQGAAYPEARANLLYHAGNYLEAAQLYDELHRRTGARRMKNYQLASASRVE